MTTLLEAMKNFFDADDWNYTEVEDEPVLMMGFSGKNGNFHCYAKAREDQQQFLFYSVCAIKAPEDRLLKVAEFITRANYGTVIGNFELDFSDGEIRYKTAIDVEGESLTFNLARNTIYPNVITMDRYLEGLMKCIYGDDSAARLIAEIEEGD